MFGEQKNLGRRNMLPWKTAPPLVCMCVDTLTYGTMMSAIVSAVAYEVSGTGEEGPRRCFRTLQRE